MSVYIWLAVLGVVGLIGLLFFIYDLTRDLKLKKILKFSFLKLLPTWLLLFCSFASFGVMVYFFLNIKEQLLQFGN